MSETAQAAQKTDLKDILSAVVFAFILAVLFVSAFFLSNIIAAKGVIPAFAYIILTAVVYGVTMISKNTKTALLKWGLSVLFSYLVLQYFWQTNYAVRALNWTDPGYGSASAGGNFAGFVQLIFLCISCLIGGIAGMFAEKKNFEKFRKVQFFVSFVSAGLVIAAVLILEQQFPAYKDIISAV